MRKQVFKFDYAEPAPISVKQIYIFHPKHPSKSWAETYRAQKNGTRLHETRFYGMNAESILYLARSIYEPSRVSTTIISPVSIKRGTRTVAPVSIVAGLVVLVAVSPLRPGSV